MMVLDLGAVVMALQIPSILEESNLLLVPFLGGIPSLPAASLAIGQLDQFYSRASHE